MKNNLENLKELNEIMTDLKENYKPFYFDGNDNKIKIHCETTELKDFGTIELKDLEKASQKGNELFKKILGEDNER